MDSQIIWLIVATIGIGLSLGMYCFGLLFIHLFTGENPLKSTKTVFCLRTIIILFNVWFLLAYAKWGHVQ